MKRRSFLQLIGLGTAGVAVGAAGAFGKGGPAGEPVYRSDRDDAELLRELQDRHDTAVLEFHMRRMREEMAHSMARSIDRAVMYGEVAA